MSSYDLIWKLIILLLFNNENNKDQNANQKD